MKVTKALTFRASSIGDSLMGKYLLENIHAQFPDARLGLLVASRGAMIRDLFAAYPWLEVIETNRKDMRGLWRLWKAFRGSDVVVTQYAGKPGGKFSLSSKLFARILAKRGGLAGFSDSWPYNALLYDTFVPLDAREAPAAHERALLKAVGIPVVLTNPELTCLAQKGILERVGVSSGAYVMVHLFAGNLSRGLSPEKRREVVSMLQKNFPDKTILVTGVQKERELALAAAEGVPNTRVIAGEVSLQEAMNLIMESSGVVSVDTGMAHMTAQLKKPLVVLATCLGPNWWSPEQYGADRSMFVYTDPDAHPGGHVSQDYPLCINNISLSSIVAGAKALFV